ncbi:MAG: S-layer homology domain-containing protein [Clostridia bacterium]|nr:S-layer homology domain-containing protein [Clostridia bacterium]
MKRFSYFSAFLALLTLMCTPAFAKTHITDIVHTDTIEYTLEQEDKLSAELYIDEDGLYNVKIVDMASEQFVPKLAITVSSKGKELYRFETKSRLLDDGSISNKEFEFALGLTEGEYKVEFENLTKFSSLSFRVETNFTAEENIETTNNNSFENATHAERNTKYFGGVTMANEVDYYYFEMPYDGYAFVRMYSPHLKFFTLYDENKNEIGNIGIEIDEADKVYELRNGLAKGKYYISVQPDEDYTLPLYTVEVNTVENQYFEKEYNNRKEFATIVLSGKEYQGNLFGTSDEDVYKFTLAEDSGIVIDFTDTYVSKEGHYSIYLSNGEDVLFSSDECGRETVALNLDKGTYYFTVTSLGHSRFTSMAYKLKVTADKALAICPPEEDSDKEENEPVIQFSDVNSSDWYAQDLLKARCLGLIEGLDGNVYNPKGNVTLAEVITMVARFHSLKNAAQVDFSLSDGTWYEPYINYAADQELIEPDNFDNFERPATRAEMAHIFSSLFEDKQTKEIIRIPDVNESTKYHKDIYKLYRIGILQGNDKDGTFNPDSKLTRAEAAVTLLRAHNMI